jgi:hypothetical protein
MALTCLSRTLDERDYAQLDEELRYVDQQGVAGAHPVRRWEYALALHAIGRWQAAGRELSGPVYNVTNGPTFGAILSGANGVYPAEVAPFWIEKARAGAQLADCITAFSVLEHLADPDDFLYGASCLLARGGLLVLTFAFWMRCGADTAVGHETRRRIYCPKLLAALRQQAEALRLAPFGGVDATWHGTQVHDYSIASLVLEKRR